MGSCLNQDSLTCAASAVGGLADSESGGGGEGGNAAGRSANAAETSSFFPRAWT